MVLSVCVFTLRALAVRGDFADLLAVLCPFDATWGDFELTILPARTTPVRTFLEGTFSWHLRADVSAGDFFELLPGDFRVELRSLFSPFFR